MNRRQVLRYGALGVAAAVGGITGSGRMRPALADEQIVSCVIHPAIGIARLGDSPTDTFIGPEVGGAHAIPDGGFKDATGRIKRQAARFRIYGMNAAGEVVREVTAADAEITWTAHLANTKAAWYEAGDALDLPGAWGDPVVASGDFGNPTSIPLRNANVEDRSLLAIDPGPRTIGGTNANADGSDPAAAFTGGRFFDREVPLGELRTDADGRLLVLGGSGVSAPAIDGLLTESYSNNDFWHDDVSDGPVDAVVRIDGQEIPTTGAWVVVAPPNYAPGVHSLVTMYDLVFSTALMLDPELAPERPSFTTMIYPLFERLHQHQWVNAGFLRDFGWGAAGDPLEPTALAQLADPGPASRFLRQAVFERFRDPYAYVLDASAIPPLYGDDLSFPADSPQQWMSILPNQYDWLRQWAEGDFDADWPEGGLRAPASLDEVPLADQPAALDRAALDEVLGGAFHPGYELSWPMRAPEMYDAPFRLARRTEPEPDWGDSLDPTVAFEEDGPLFASVPGSLTRWLAVPWQADAGNCASAYEPEVDDYLPAFWPTRVPNEVLTQAAYATVLDTTAEQAAREDAFYARVKWLRNLPGFSGSHIDRATGFLAEWSAVGIVTPRPGPAGDAAFPAQFWVEEAASLPEREVAGGHGGGPAADATPDADGG